MEITRDDIMKIADMSSLSLSEEEIQMFVQDIEKMINFAHQLDELDVEGVEPVIYDKSVYNVFRKDEVKPSTPKEELLANAPEQRNGCFFVPKVLE